MWSPAELYLFVNFTCYGTKVKKFTCFYGEWVLLYSTYRLYLDWEHVLSSSISFLQMAQFRTTDVSSTSGWSIHGGIEKGKSLCVNHVMFSHQICFWPKQNKRTFILSKVYVGLEPGISYLYVNVSVLK